MPRRMSPVSWAVVALIGLTDVIGELLDLPGALRALAQLHHHASVPVDEFALAPFLIVTGTADLLTVLGLVGFRRRQVNVI